MTLDSKYPTFVRFLTNSNLQVVLALIYIGIYAVQVIGRPNGALNDSLDYASYFINFFFFIDFIVRFGQAKSKFNFVFSNLIELISIALPFLRVLRIFRILVALNVFKRHLGTRQARAGLGLGLALPLVTLFSALAILDAEVDAPGATITNFPIAIWWSIATMATVGDGNLSPVTWPGRAIASALMILGIGLFGAVAALFAATFINSPKTENGD